MLFRFT